MGERLQELREALINYYGYLNEIQMMAQIGQVSTPKQVEKPEALKLWQQCQALGLPIVAGGLMDQPYIWLMEIAIVREVEIVMQNQVVPEKKDAG